GLLRLDRRAYAVAGRAVLRRDREVRDALGIRAAARLGRNIDLVTNLGRRPAAGDEEVASDDLSGEGSQLVPVDALGRRAPVAARALAGTAVPPARVARPRVAAEHGVLELDVPRLQRLVDAVEEERAKRGVGRDVGDGEADRREHDDAQQEPGAEGE